MRVTVVVRLPADGGLTVGSVAAPAGVQVARVEGGFEATCAGDSLEEARAALDAWLAAMGSAARA